MAVLTTVRNIEQVDEYCRVGCDAVYPDIYDMIYLLTAIGLSLGGSTRLHTNNI
jgi:hypothetical protein